MAGQRRFARNVWRLVCASGVMGVVAFPLHGADVTSVWIDASSGNWHDAAQWSSEAVPDNDDNGATFVAVLDAQGSPYTVRLDRDIG